MIDFPGFIGTEVVAFAVAPVLIMRCKGIWGSSTDTIEMPVGMDEIPSPISGGYHCVQGYQKNYLHPDRSGQEGQ